MILLRKNNRCYNNNPEHNNNHIELQPI